jgi:hypothetical protein
MSHFDWRRLRIESHDAKERRKPTAKTGKKKDAPRTCRYCGVPLKNAARLKRHLRLQHTAERKARTKRPKKRQNRPSMKADTRPRLRLHSGQIAYPVRSASEPTESKRS